MFQSKFLPCSSSHSHGSRAGLAPPLPLLGPSPIALAPPNLLGFSPSSPQPRLSSASPPSLFRPSSSSWHRPLSLAPPPLIFSPSPSHRPRPLFSGPPPSSLNSLYKHRSFFPVNWRAHRGESGSSGSRQDGELRSGTQNADIVLTNFRRSIRTNFRPPADEAQEEG